MVFSSTFFLFLFLPVVLAFSLLPGRIARNVVLLLASCFFYFWSENWCILILFASGLIDYTIGLGIAGALTNRKPIELLPKGGRRSRTQRTLLIASVVMNLSLLGFFKYTNFGLRNYNILVGLFGLDGLQWDPLPKIILPLGISFYTFQSMSYTFDVYLGHCRATRSLFNYTNYIIMFPQLVAGPIVRYRDVANQLVERSVTLGEMAYGIRRFVIGMGKKVLIANTLAVPVNEVFNIPFSQLTPGLVWLGTFGFCLQIYYDFSGYSDMAIGLGQMLGFRFKENFRYPYISTSATEYFQRWHISLNTWLRDYPYKAMGGSRGSALRVYFNVILLLVMVGIWHGARWNFITWGLVCGLLLAVQRYMIRNQMRIPIPHPLKVVVCFLIFMSTMVFFRSESLSQAFVFLKGLFGQVHGDGVEYHAGLYLNRKVILCLVLGYIGSLPLVPWIAERYEAVKGRLGNRSALGLEVLYCAGRLACVAAVFLASAMALAGETHNPFIYFRF